MFVWVQQESFGPQPFFQGKADARVIAAFTNL